MPRETDSDATLFRDHFWTDHDMLRDDCIVTGSPVAKLLLLGLLTKIGRDRRHWNLHIDSLRVMCNDVHAATVRAAMGALRRSGLADFKSIRGEQPGWYRCTVARSNFADFANVRAQHLTRSHQKSRTRTSGIAKLTTCPTTEKTTSPNVSSVEGALSNFGMKDWRSALTAARRRNATDAEIISAIETCQRFSDRWKTPVGALHWWMRTGAWPAGCEQRQLTRVELEAVYGATVRALDDADIRRLLQQFEPTALQLLDAGGGRSNDAVHHRLLRAYQRSVSTAEVAR